MTLQEQAKQLREALQDYGVRDKRKQQASEYQERLDNLKKQHKRLRMSRELQKLYQRNQFPFFDEKKERFEELIEVLHERTVQVKQSVKTTGQIDESSGYVELIEAFKDFESFFKETAQAAWKEYRQKKLPEIKVQQLKNLKKIPILESKVQEFETITEQIKKSSLPNAEAELKRFLQLSEKAETLLRELDLETTKEVQDFIQAAKGEKGAELKLYTELVQMWIEQSQKRDAFRIFLTEDEHLKEPSNTLSLSLECKIVVK